MLYRYGKQNHLIMKFLALSLFTFFSFYVNSQSTEIIISYNKGACMGKCPVYSISVDNQGLLRYDGKLNVEKIGIYKTQLTDKEMKKLLCKFEQAKINQLDDNYGMDIMDVQMTTIAYKDSTMQKIIMSKIELPKKLMKAETYLQSLTKDSKNKKIKWTREEEVEKNLGRKEMVEKLVIVQLNEETIIENWIKKYSKYGLRLNKQITPNQPLYLVHFDPKTIQIGKLLKQLNADVDVKSAEENKKVEMR